TRTTKRSARETCRASVSTFLAHGAVADERGFLCKRFLDVLLMPGAGNVDTEARQVSLALLFVVLVVTKYRPRKAGNAPQIDGDLYQLLWPQMKPENEKKHSQTSEQDTDDLNHEPGIVVTRTVVVVFLVFPVFHIVRPRTV